MKRLNASILIAILSVSSNLALAGEKKPKPLTLAQAVQSAERFIRENGYTDLPPMKDTSKLAYESIEWARNRKDLLEYRRNTLERKAYGYVRDNKGRPGWTVVFRSKHHRGSTNGRAVTMTPDGKHLRVEHVDFILKYAHKLSTNKKTLPYRKR